MSSPFRHFQSTLFIPSIYLPLYVCCLSPETYGRCVSNPPPSQAAVVILYECCQLLSSLWGRNVYEPGNYCRQNCPLCPKLLHGALRPVANLVIQSKKEIWKRKNLSPDFCLKKCTCKGRQRGTKVRCSNSIHFIPSCLLKQTFQDWGDAKRMQTLLQEIPLSNRRSSKEDNKSLNNVRSYLHCMFCQCHLFLFPLCFCILCLCQHSEALLDITKNLYTGHKIQIFKRITKITRSPHFFAPLPLLLYLLSEHWTITAVLITS